MKSRRKLLIYLVAAAALAAAAFKAWQAFSAKEPDGKTRISPQEQQSYVHIGVLAPIQGEYSAYGASIVRGAKAAEHVVNAAGGVNGKPIKLHIADTRSQTAVAAELAGDLVNRVGVSLIVGGYDDEVDLRVARLAPNLKVPYIYLNNGGAKTCSEQDVLEPSAYVWGMGLTNHMSVEPLLVHLADKLRKPESEFQIYYFGTTGRATEPLANYLVRSAEELNFRTIEVEMIDPRIRDLFTHIRGIFRRRPDLLFVLTAPKATPNFLTQAAKLGIKAEMPVASLDSFNEEMTSTLGDAADEIVTVSRYVSSLDNESNKEFLAAWKALNPELQEAPTELAAMSYGAVKIGAQALINATADDKPATAESFRVAMQDLQIDLPQGTVVVSASNNLLIQPAYAVKVKQGRYEFVEYLGDVSHPALDSCMIEQKTDE